MEVVLLMLMGLAWVLVYIGKGARWLFESHKEGIYNLTAKDIVATDDEVFAVTRMLQSPQNRRGGFAEIQDVLDDIFGDEWYYWTGLSGTAWDKLPGEARWQPYREFKNVCFHLLLAKTGKVYNGYGGRVASCPQFSYFSEEESMEIFKKISFAIEKMLIEKHPDHAHDLEMMTKKEYFRYRTVTFIGLRFYVNSCCDASKWDMLEP